MNIVIGADHAGYELKGSIRERLEAKGYKVEDVGTHSSESVDYPDYAVKACEKVVAQKAGLGILVCGSGIGVSITANKIKGIRAANCITEEMAELARKHNNANVLTLGARLVDEATAEKIVDTFIRTEFEGGRHEKRVDKIHSLTGC